MNSLIPLSSLAPGEKGRIVHYKGGYSLTARLASVGFTPGAELMVMSNSGKGPLLVFIRGLRVALGRKEAHQIWVLRIPHQGL